MIDGGATHKFIDPTWVAKRGIPTEKFEGFTVAVAGIISWNATIGFPN